MSKWLRFLRQYGPIASNDNMYDETILRSARRSGVKPIEFHHPHRDRLIALARLQTGKPLPIVLTGTAGDGKTHLCRQAWKELGGDEAQWEKDDPHLVLGCGEIKIHFIRDLSAWAPQQGQEWSEEKAALLARMCQSFFDATGDESFVVAANDGQLVESWRRLPTTDVVDRARGVIEDLLVEDRQEAHGARLTLLNLSRTSSAALFDCAVEALLHHPGWEELLGAAPDDNGLFGPRCPVRHNFELLRSELVRFRLRALLELCDCSSLHVPIRQILLLLSNSLLGHPDVKDHLMSPADVPGIIAAGTGSRASLYHNIFGGNLSETRRHTITIFEYLGRFKVGHETCNRVDNILIFGEDDSELRADFDALVAEDKFYGADESFRAAKREYIEGPGEVEGTSNEFLDMLVRQRRGLFFRIPKDAESAISPWRLTVFKFAGEYLEEVLAAVRSGEPVKRTILSRLVRGLNRVFTGMLVNSDRELCLATSGNYSQARVSRVVVDRVSVEPSKGERVVVRMDATGGCVLLSVFLTPDLSVDLGLTLVRYEFLSRVSQEGALPKSFSKQCYEDLLSFKSQLLAACLNRQASEPGAPTRAIGLNLLALTDQGMLNPTFVEVTP